MPRVSDAGLGQVISWYICTGVAVLFAAGRFIFHWRQFGRFTIPDGLVLLSTACLIADLVIQHYMWARGMDDMANATRDDFIAIMQCIIPGSVLYVSSLFCIKFAMVLFYKKLAAPGTRLQYVYTGTLGVLGAMYLVIFFDILFQCFPNDKRWSMDPDFNILSDVFIICLPVSMVLKLKMKRRQKIGLVVVFSLGFCVVISSIVRAYYSSRNETMLTCTVSMVETAIAIVASCLPDLRSLLVSRTTRTGTGSYGKHYELSSLHRRTPRSQSARNTSQVTRINSDGEEELVKVEAPSPDPEIGYGIGVDKIMVENTYTVRHEDQEPYHAV
ncbi:hypothetical protein GGR56DRAFT_678453 [Xylariaceae sp. FL0804]|nr:hypothetical protein GGR56DRAFT_678453 [Xylariaceae sp. FL0804]